MSTGGEHPTAHRWGRPRRAWLIVLAIVVAGLVVFALSRLELSRAGHALINAHFGWIGLALALMASSLVLRSVSWYQVLRAALPDTVIRWPPVIRATMIGVMASAIFPGRVGEPSRALVITRRLDGPKRQLLPIVAGTVFSQTLMNLIALAILAGVTLTGAPLITGHAAGIATAVAIPLAVVLLVVFGPRLLARAERSRFARLRTAAGALGRLLTLARRGLVVFARPGRGFAAVAAQLGAWTLQWLACYMVVLALGLQSQANLVTAAAILLAVNLSAILPATPSNVGVFQAACLVVLAAYGVGTGTGLAYGILLQAVEVVTALLLGVPALLGEGLSWREIRSVEESARERPGEELAGERPVEELAGGHSDEESAGERPQ
jgi:phosphatidylinositol alpha-mannosyltransferase